MNSDSYKILEDEKIQIKPILNYHFTQLLTGTRRNIQKKPNLANPWKVKSTTNLHVTVFLKWYKAVRDFRVKTYRNIHLKKNKKGEVTDIIISFTHIGPLCYHLGKAVNVKTKETFTEKYLSPWPDGCVGNVVVDEETPAILTFSMKSGRLFFCELRG